MPERCLVNKKITKAFFKRNFDLTISEKELLHKGSLVISIDWQVSLSPANANINPYADEGVSFEEVQVISVKTISENFSKNIHYIAELIQKHIPYPILLCIANDEAFVLNTCDKRINQNDRHRRTIEKRYFSEEISYSNPSQQQQEFLTRLTFARLDKTNLKTLYECITNEIVSLQAAAVTGVFMPRSHTRTSIDVKHLEQIDILQQEIIGMEKTLKKESQVAERVAQNIRIQDLKKEIENLKCIISAS